MYQAHSTTAGSASLTQSVYPFVIVAIAAFLITRVLGAAEWTLFPLLVLTLGVPHGLFDPWLFHPRWHHTLPRTAWFLGLYILPVGLMLGAWMLFPVLTLIVFLSISSYHFGADWQPAQPVRWQAARQSLDGFMVILFPWLFSATSTAGVFEKLTGAPWSAATVPLTAILALNVIDALHRGRWKALTDWACLALAAWVFSPVFYFAIFFCAMHSLRHYSHHMEVLESFDRRDWRWLAAIGALTYVFLAGLFLFVRASGELDEATLKMVFWGLASLSVPHMAVIETGHPSVGS